MEPRVIEVGYGDVNRVSIGGRLPLAFIGGASFILSRDLAPLMGERVCRLF